MNKAYTVCFDGTCGLCGKGVKFLKRHLPAADEAVYAALQDQAVLERLGMSTLKPLTEMKVIRADDSIIGGPDAVRYLAGRIGWLKPLAVISRAPILRQFSDFVYWRIARNRHRLSCRLSLDPE